MTSIQASVSFNLLKDLLQFFSLLWRKIASWGYLCLGQVRSGVLCMEPAPTRGHVGDARHEEATARKDAKAHVSYCGTKEAE